MKLRAWSAEHGVMCRKAKRNMKEKLFRFQDLEIWIKAIEISDKFLNVADELETKKLYRFTEQLRGASLGI